MLKMFPEEAKAMYVAPISLLQAEVSLRGVNDLTFSLIKLLETASREVDTDRAAAKASIAQASSLLQVQVERTAARSPNNRALGGLTTWQIHRVSTFVDEHLEQPIRVEDMGQVLRLSVTYFRRAFRRSFGETPHAYLIRRRVDWARHLMLTSDMALSEVAQACGFADQAHLCRQFRQCIGASPASWRRERRDPDAQLTERNIGRQENGQS
jgi:AraC family transcriptional regulator